MNNQNQPQILTDRETFRNMHRVLDIFRELDQESRDILLRFLVNKYTNKEVKT